MFVRVPHFRFRYRPASVYRNTVDRRKHHIERDFLSLRRRFHLKTHSQRRQVGPSVDKFLRRDLHAVYIIDHRLADLRARIDPFAFKRVLRKKFLVLFRHKRRCIAEDLAVAYADADGKYAVAAHTAQLCGHSALFLRRRILLLHRLITFEKLLRRLQSLPFQKKRREAFRKSFALGHIFTGIMRLDPFDPSLTVQNDLRSVDRFFLSRMYDRNVTRHRSAVAFLSE